MRSCLRVGQLSLRIFLFTNSLTWYPRLVYSIVDTTALAFSSFSSTSTPKQAFCFANTMPSNTNTASVVDSIHRQGIYVAVGEFTCQKGRTEAFAKGIEASMAKFYRTQPGVHVYMVGVSSLPDGDGDDNGDTVLLTMVASNKELFHSLPKHEQDLEKLNKARGPYFALLKGSTPEEARRFVETSYTVGGSVSSMLGQLPPAVPDDATPLRWEDSMGLEGIDPSTVTKHSQYVAVAEYKTKPGRAEEVAKGFEATQGIFYRSHSDCLLYLHGVIDDETVLSVTVWTSQQAFESHPSNDELNQAREPFRALLVGPTFQDSVRYRGTAYVVGDQLSKI